jgi:alanyl-tRNA synthetase
MKSTDIRNTFFEFFKSKSHLIVPSAPMVIKDDPTLMFTNAGMNQFKDIFLGNTLAPSPRIADTQKCLRVSGKHNDLEEVGHDTYHHTMFEMLGNWSFGDYFKKEAIAWAWELLTQVYRIPTENLYVTVFGGDQGDGLAPDQEAFDYWKEWTKEDRILYGSKKDNFWEMGDSGPCGPCSEIHVDLRTAQDKAAIPGKDLVNQDHPLVIEIWNLVFIEFNRKANGILESLPAKHVDTGMGFERLSMVLQGKTSNYDTDIFQPLIGEISRISGIGYGADNKADTAMRVIADHLRAVAFAIADGQIPSNVRAGYVIRRILRRAVRYAYTFLRMEQAFIHQLVPLLARQMGGVFPELVKQEGLIIKVIQEEEQGFLRTLSTGIQKFNQYLEKAGDARLIDGAFAFELFDTYGFPIDLTRLMAREEGLDVDMVGFEKGLEAQKARSRADAAQDADDWQIIANQKEAGSFIGWDQLQADARILRYRKVMLKKQTYYQVVLNRTPFYAEAGGQIGDRGYLEQGGKRIEVEDTRKENQLTIHITKALPENVEETVKAVVDLKKRKQTAANHTATHLLHHALRSVLGDHVEQKGSLVAPDRLRFDFAHFGRMQSEEIRQVENLVNAAIRENRPRDEQRRIALNQAMEMGAIALFGEKYGDEVRVIRFGESVELCGGTHVEASGEIGLFKIISESAIAAGIRRIEAVSGEAALEFLNEKQDQLEVILQLFKNVKDPVKAVRDALEDKKEIEKKLQELEQQQINTLKDKLLAEAKTLDGIRCVVSRVDLPAKLLKDLAFNLEKAMGNALIVLGAGLDGKATLSIMISQSVIDEKHLHAGKMIRELAPHIGGGGGGQAHFATAGGSIVSGLEKALHASTQSLHP